MWDRGDVAEPVDVALVGDASTIKDEIKRLETLAVADLSAFIFRAEPGAFEQTSDFLGSLFRLLSQAERAVGVAFAWRASLRLKQGPRLFKISSVVALGEPRVDLCELRECFVAPSSLTR